MLYLAVRWTQWLATLRTLSSDDDDDDCVQWTAIVIGCRSNWQTRQRLCVPICRLSGGGPAASQCATATDEQNWCYKCMLQLLRQPSLLFITWQSCSKTRSFLDSRNLFAFLLVGVFALTDQETCHVSFHSHVTEGSAQNFSLASWQKVVGRGRCFSLCRWLFKKKHKGCLRDAPSLYSLNVINYFIYFKIGESCTLGYKWCWSFWRAILLCGTVFSLIYIV